MMKRLSIPLGLILAGSFVFLSIRFDPAERPVPVTGEIREQGGSVPPQEPAPEPDPPAAAVSMDDIAPRLGEGEMISISQEDIGDGWQGRTRIVRVDFKYPLIRIEDEISRHPDTGRESIRVQKAMVADHVIVRLHDGADEAAFERFVRARGASIRHRIPGTSLRLVSFEPSDGNALSDMLEVFNSEKDLVSYAEPDHLVQPSAVPNDPLFPLQWDKPQIHAPDAWDIETGSASVIVGVIDTGVDHTHPDLAPNIWTNPGEVPGNGIDDDGNGYIDDTRGWDFYSADNDPMDVYDHGTLTAGTVGAKGNNAIGITGVCWDVSLLPLRFMGPTGFGTTSGAAEAIRYATRAGVKLTTNSWIGYGSQAIRDAIVEADEAGILFVAAAGNFSTNNDTIPYFPCNYDIPNVISVAATWQDDHLAGFSNYGPQTVHLAAPGLGIHCCGTGGSYISGGGTSIATPMVAGACALLWSRQPALTGRQVKDILLHAVDPIPALQDKLITGGRLNVDRMMRTRFLVLPDPQVSFSGLTGGPFEPASQTFTLTNATAETVTWQVTTTESWVDTDVSGGTIPPAGSVDVVVSIAGPAAELGPGGHTAVLTFGDLTHGLSESREVALTVLDPLQITPAGGYAGRGHEGGPFAPENIIYQLHNISALPLTWNAAVTAAEPGTIWAGLSLTSGNLAAGSDQPITLGLLPAAADLPLGTHHLTLDIANETSGEHRLIPVEMTIGPDYFTQTTAAMPAGLDGHTYTFTPDDSPDGYKATREPALFFPTDPSGGATCNFENTQNADPFSIPLGGQVVSIYGTAHTSLFANASGTLTFGTPGSANPALDLADHFARPGVSAMHGPLNPYQGGTCTWRALPDRIAVTWLHYHDNLGNGDENFQIEVFFDGRIRITFAGIALPGRLIGLSAGNGLPADFFASDFTSYPPPTAIASQPRDIHVRAGRDASFRVGMHGEGPFGFQWRRAGEPIDSATGDTLTIHAAQAADAGGYDVVVDTPDGPITSRTATLGVSDEHLGNGSFEDDFASWQSHGNISIQSGAPYASTDGSRLVVFNSMNSLPNGLLTQTFATIPGKTYLLDFDMGVLAFNTKQQRLEIRVDGSGPLLHATESLNGLGGGAVRWVSKHFEFVADDVFATLGFRDVSLETTNIDLLLDHVRLTLIHQLDIGATGAAPVSVAVSPPDRNGMSGGDTWFVRSYTDGTEVTLTAPAAVAGAEFDHWLMDGEIWSTDPVATVTMNDDRTMIAVLIPPFSITLDSDEDARAFLGTGPFTRLTWTAFHFNGSADTIDWSAAGEVPEGSADPVFFKTIPSHGSTPPLDTLRFRIVLTEAALDLPAGPHAGRVTVHSPQRPPVDVAITLHVIAPDQYLTNPDFESGLAGWTHSGNVMAGGPPSYTASHGAGIVAFNGQNSTPNGVVSQTILTEPGVSYRLTFDMGVLAFNTNRQDLKVEAWDAYDSWAPFFTRTLAMNGVADGKCHWQPKDFTFTAASDRTEIRFTDISTATIALDLLLDNVVVSNPGFHHLVTTLADENDPSPGMGTGESLRECLIRAGSTAGAKHISFQSGLEGGVIDLAHGELSADVPVAIDSRNACTTIVSHGLSRVLTTNSGGALHNLTIAGGDAAFANDYPYGGGIANSGPLALTDVGISQNEAPGLGGGLLSWGDVLATRCTIGDNRGGTGGGAYFGGNALLQSCLVADNTATAAGGGLACSSGLASSALMLAETTVARNEAPYGGGYAGIGGYKYFGNLFAENSTFSGNTAVHSGGAIQGTGFAALDHCTVADNHATDPAASGGGIAGPDLTIGNSIVAGNSAATDPDLAGSPTLLAPVLTGGGAKLAPLAGYGGLTPTMPPLPGSPAIDAAEPLPGTRPTDQLGASRPRGAAPDLGAVEAFPFSELALVDADDDGIDDRLEPAYGLVVGNDDRTADTDGDGSPDAEEIANMTDPFDPASLLRILSITPLDQENAYRLVFPTFPGLSYTLECDQALDFHGPAARAYPLGEATGDLWQIDVPFLPGSDFARIRRDP